MGNGNKYIDKLSIDSYSNYGDANGKCIFATILGIY